MEAIFGYMTESEKSWAIIKSVMDNKLLKLNYEFEKVMMEHQENLLAIENKVLMESGSADDLEMLYLAEAEETKEKGQGVLGKIIAAVKAFFKKLKEVLFGKTPENLPDEVEVPEDPDALLKEGNTLLGNIRSFFSGKKGALRAAAIAVGTTAAVVITKKKIIPTIKDAERFITDSGQELDRIENHTNGLSPDELNLVQKAVAKLKTIGGRASQIVKTLNSGSYRAHVKDEKAKKFENLSAGAQEMITKLTDRNKNIDSEVSQLKKDYSAAEKELGKGFFARIFTQAGRDRAKYESLSKKFHSGKNLTTEELAQYRSLVSQIKTKDATIGTRMDIILKKIDNLLKEQLSNEKKLGKLGVASVKNADKAGKLRAKAGEIATKAAEELTSNESVDDLIDTANAEVDYFMNSLL